MNNTGKTSFLKALQLALGNGQFISQDDFFIEDNKTVDKITIDLLIIPIDSTGQRQDKFEDDWEVFFTLDRIQSDGDQFFIPLRTLIVLDNSVNFYKTENFILSTWPAFKDENDRFWYESDNGNKRSFNFDKKDKKLPFHYMNAQRDILEDIKLKTSYLGRMISKIEYSPQVIKDIEEKIKELNEQAVDSSTILSRIKETLKDLNTAMDNQSEGVEITPFTKKVRDLSKGLSIHYTEKKDSFSMEYHGMGTRSWSSLLTLKAYILIGNLESQSESEPENKVFFPILAIEEPEAHLHPNAQKMLYRQINEIVGQKIISTHSPYIAASAQLQQVRNLYKKDNIVSCGKVNLDNLSNGLSAEDIRKINRQVINTRGEIFFSKLLIFFEGETEEQALPIFAEHYFGKKFKKTPVEMGIDFVGVSGFGNYSPFLKFAEAFGIPWLIFSDADSNAGSNIKESVQQQFRNCNCEQDENNVIIFLNDGNNFEKQLIADGYGEEIKNVILSFDEYENEHHRNAKEEQRKEEVNQYNDEKLYKVITGAKTQFGPVIAEEIIESGKVLPPKVIELFQKIEQLFCHQEPS
jgi:putative ATP-dependent endonuclease of OLD family